MSSNKEIQILKGVLVAATTYVAIVNDPPKVPHHKQTDAERNAFDNLEDAVRDAISARKEAEQEPSDQAELDRKLGTFSEPPEKGAWS